MNTGAHQIERELRDAAPRRVRLTDCGQKRRWLTANVLFVLLCVGFTIAVKDVFYFRHLVAAFHRNYVLLIPFLLAPECTLGLYLAATQPLSAEARLLREGQAVTAVVTNRYASVLNGAGAFVIGYECVLPPDLGGGLLRGRATVTPSEIQQYPEGSCLTLLVLPQNPSCHRPYFTLRYAQIEGAPRRVWIS